MRFWPVVAHSVVQSVPEENVSSEGAVGVTVTSTNTGRGYL